MAIACGNTFVLKPSERDPSASNFVAELYARGRAARRRLQRRARRQGRGRRDPRPPGHRGRVVRRLDADRAATSTSGRRATGKRVQALGGAKNHAVVLPDADLDFAANHLTAAGFGSAGQRCMAISAAVAVGDAADPLVERPGAQGARRQGRPRPRPDERDGPGRHRRRRASGSSATSARGEQQGATLRRRRPRARRSTAEDGFFVGPTLIDHVTHRRWTSTREEIFGPVLVGRARRRRSTRRST